MKRAFVITAITTLAIAGSAMTASAFGKNREEGPRPPRIEFKELDANSDGQITQEEMQAHFKAQFDATDANKDGALSAEEMAARAETDRAARMAKRTEQMISRHDANKDGVLQLEEMQTKGHAQMFNRLDSNGDGTISEEEYAELGKGRGGKGKFGRHGGGNGWLSR